MSARKCQHRVGDVTAGSDPDDARGVIETAFDLLDHVAALQPARGVGHPLVDRHLHDHSAVGRWNLLQPDLVKQLP